MKEPIELLKEALINNLSRNEQRLDESYFRSSKGITTRRMMIERIKNNTPEGMEDLVNLINLSAHILTREYENGE